jgi:hypothetical protein
MEIPCVTIGDKAAKKQMIYNIVTYFLCSAGMAEVIETIEVTATQRQANVTFGEEEAGVNKGSRFWT